MAMITLLMELRLVNHRCSLRLTFIIDIHIAEDEIEPRIVADFIEYLQTDKCVLEPYVQPDIIIHVQTNAELAEAEYHVEQDVHVYDVQVDTIDLA